MLLILSLLSFLPVALGQTSLCQRYNGQCGSQVFQMRIYFSFFWERLELRPSWNQDLYSRMRTGRPAPKGYWGARYKKKFTNPKRTSLKKKMWSVMDMFQAIFKKIWQKPDWTEIGCACNCSFDEATVEIGCFFEN